MGYKVPVGISNKHIHLSQADLETLFGAGATLTNKKDLKQPNQFAAEEQVQIVGPKGSATVRVLGPVRKETQIELSMTDVRTLGLKGVPMRQSGHLEGTPGMKVVGPKGEVELDHGVIGAQRHIHLNDAQAAEAGVKDQQVVSVKIVGDRELIFGNVVCRCGSAHEREFHIDTDEGNAAALANDVEVEIIL
ncbi:MAG: phosphate propanoyltransferase [Bacillota bacterium]|nr:phosphate propanoyltransferase [Bacillota bacterium]